MANEYHEKDYDDEVYEDDYYEEHYDEEELEDDNEIIDEDESDKVAVEEEEEDVESKEWDDEKRVTISFACEDCDYRWDDFIVKKKGNLEDEEEELDVICPMCGSINVTQI